MSKRPEIIALANKGSIAFLEELTKIPKEDDSEMCLAVSAKDLSFDFTLGNTSPKSECVTCKMLAECVSLATRFGSEGAAGSVEKKKQAIQHGLSDNDIRRLSSEMNFILHSPASEVSAHYNVESRTVVRWRGTIRSSL